MGIIRDLGRDIAVVTEFAETWLRRTALFKGEKEADVYERSEAYCGLLGRAGVAFGQKASTRICIENLASKVTRTKYLFMSTITRCQILLNTCM